MTAARWQVSPVWRGETVAILACGPSMSADVAASVIGKCRTIAINNAYSVAFGADLLYFCDRRWFEWHNSAVLGFPGEIVTLENYDLGPIRLRHLHNYGRDGLQIDPPDGVRTGRNSGYQAINLAVLMGTRRILLLGYDMRWIDGRSHFHDGHPVPTGADIYDRCMLPMFEQLPPLLEPLGVEVINCTPGSGLKVFPAKNVADCV